MKKLMCFTVYVVMILNISAGFCFGDPESLFHVVIANVEKVSGGNSRISYEPVDLHLPSNKEECAYQKYKFNQDYPSHKGNYPSGATLQPQGSGSGKRAGKVPTEKNGLLNAKNPINVVSYNDKVFFYFQTDEHQKWLSSAVRILDSSGKVLASLNEDDDVAEIKVPSKAGKYYVELSRNDSGKPEYFYILMSMKATDVKPAYSARLAKEEAESAKAQQKQLDEIMSAEQAYMKKHGITKREDLTQKDMEAIAEELRRKKKGEYDADPSGTDIMSHLPEEYKAILLPYMKEHGISRIEDLTAEDWKNLAPELEKLQNEAGAANKATKSKATNKKRK